MSLKFVSLLLTSKQMGQTVESLQFSAAETMGALGTNFVTEGFWDCLGGHGK